MPETKRPDPGFPARLAQWLVVSAFMVPGGAAICVVIECLLTGATVETAFTAGNNPWNVLVAAGAFVGSVLVGTIASGKFPRPRA